MKVLIAEDDTASRMVLQKHLQEWGYQVLAAEDGNKAWEIIQTNQPRIVLIDWIMPGIDGLELCKKIRSLPNKDYTYLIFLTSKTENQDIVTALDTGADDFLSKPFDKNVFRSKIAVGARTIDYEDKLLQSEERYQRITESITDYIFTIQISDGKISKILHGDAAIAVTGYNAEELNTKESLWLEMVHNDYKQIVSRQLEKCASNQKTEPLEYKIIRKDGNLRWVKSTIVQHFGKAGQVDWCDCLLQDITERKTAEEHMIQAKQNAEDAQAKLEKLNLQLELTYKKLMEAAHSAGMAEAATNVLHNVGNSLNSVNVSAAIVGEKLSKSEIPYLQKLAELVKNHAGDLANFLTNDPQGKYIPTYLSEVSNHLVRQKNEIIESLNLLIKNVAHTRDIIHMQEFYTGIGQQQDCVSLPDIIENTLEINNTGLQRNNIEVIREYEDLGNIFVDKHRIIQILLCLIDNAEHALAQSSVEPKQLKIRLTKHNNLKVRIEISDNGIGIKPEDLDRIFSVGFTTKSSGHGFGLHGCLLAMNDMKGTIIAKSPGQNCGATFIIEFPFQKTGVKNEKHN
ncbi:MAG: response regulator [Sedimentisphaerales bacterium]|nr:response regulator [Sedimentisphaerales bacterium]